MDHPYAELLGLTFDEQREGYSRCALTVAEKHFNPHRVVHGAVLYALADTGMGAALYPTLEQGEACATIGISIRYFKPVARGVITCTSALIHRGRSVANLESRIYCDDALVAAALGNFSVFRTTAA